MNTIYRGTAEQMLAAITTHPLTVQLLGGTYLVDPLVHRFLIDVDPARIGPAVPLTGITIADGILDADDVTLPGVTVTDAMALVLYGDSGDPATSPLIGLIDQAGGFPLSTVGGDVIVSWNNSPDRILRV